MRFLGLNGDIESITLPINLKYYHLYQQKIKSSSLHNSSNISSNHQLCNIDISVSALTVEEEEGEGGKSDREHIKIQDSYHKTIPPPLIFDIKKYLGNSHNNHNYKNLCSLDNPLIFCCYDKMISLSALVEFPQNIDTDIFVLKEYDRLKMLQEQQGPRHTEILLRKEDNVGGRKALKEKFVEIYEAFFNGEDPSEGQPSFWEQLFLIKVNAPFLERCIILTSEDHLLALKPNLNKIFTQCCHWLRNPNTTSVRITHILETLSVLLKSIFRKKFNSFGFDVLNILCGIETADTIFKELIEDLQKLLVNPDVKIRIGTINLLNIIVTATEFINQNTLLNFFMVVNIFDTLVDTIIDKELPKTATMGALSLLIYLSNFQKYEIINPYNKKIAALTNEDKVKGLVSVITKSLHDQNKFYFEQYREPNQTMASRFTGYLSSWVYTPEIVNPCTSSETGSSLMMLYELVYQNETFIKLLSSGALSTSSCPEIIKEFLIYCGHLASDSPKESKTQFTKLSLNILLCLSERRELEDYFHDLKTTSYIFIYSKKNLYPDPKETDKQPISIYIINILNQFIKCNLKGKLSSDVHHKILSCIQRVVSYKKKTQARLPMKWNDTWLSLFSFITSINMTTEKNLLSDLIPVGIEAIDIFNLFINYGDLFLPQPSDYDDLFYELIRGRQVIEEFSKLVELEDPTGNMMSALLNIKSIIAHFSAHTQAWSNEHPEEPLTSDKVVSIIKDNYETLRLKLAENLDNFEKYVENSSEAVFYRHYIRFLILDTKTNLNLALLTINK